MYNQIMKYLIFDFNGTVLDDMDVCLEAENRTIEHYGLERKPLTREEYLDIFTFPVKDYYEAVGFDWNKFSYEEVGAYWFSWYRKLKDKYKVFDGVIELCEKNRQAGNRNILLSASSRIELLKQLDELEIAQYFDEVLGIDNIYAGSKLDVALNWMKDKKAEECLMIGDTLHDLEVAKEMGIRCVLVAKGHQPKEKLMKYCDEVYDDIREVDICA